MKTPRLLVAFLIALMAPIVEAEPQTVVIDLGIVTAQANSITEFNREVALPTGTGRWIGWKVHWTRNSNPDSFLEVSATDANGNILAFHSFDLQSPKSSDLELFPVVYRENPIFLHFTMLGTDIATQARPILQLFAR